MKLSLTLLTLFWGIVSSIIIKIIVDKGIIFIEEWNISTQHYIESYNQDQKCKQNYDISNTFPKECANAALIIQSWPFSKAIGETVKKTPTCIVIKCVDLAAMVLNSWLVITIITLLVSYFFMMFFKKAKRFKEEKRYKYFLSLPGKKKKLMKVFLMI